MTSLSKGDVQHASTLLGLVPSSNNTTSTGSLSRRIHQFSSSLLLPSFPLQWVQRHTPSLPIIHSQTLVPRPTPPNFKVPTPILNSDWTRPSMPCGTPTLLEGAASLAASVILTLLGAGSTATCQFFAPFADKAFCNAWSAIFSAFSAIRLMFADNTRSIADLDTALSLK